MNRKGWTSASKSLAAALFLLAGCEAVAASPDMTVFGVALGQPPSIPDCKKEDKWGVATCYAFDPYPRDVYGQDHATIRLSSEQQAQNYDQGFSTMNPAAILINDSVESISISTQGDSQEALLRLLTKKYGKPHSVNRRILQNAFGAKVVSYSARWRFNELSVEFDGATSMDSGWLSVFTPKYVAQQKEGDAARGKKTVPF